MDVVITIALVAGAFCLITVVRLCWPFRIDASDLSKLVAGGKRYIVYTFTGTVSNSSRTAETTVTDDRAVQGNFNEWGGTITTTGSVRAKTTLHDQFFLTSAQGDTHNVQVDDLSLPVGNGQLVSVAWAVRKGRKRGQYFMYRNHTTNQYLYDPVTMRTLVYGSTRNKRRTRVYAPSTTASTRFWLLALALAWPTTGVSVAALLPALIAGWLIGKARIGAFERSSGASLIASLDANATAAPPKVTAANQADELTKLSAMARDGLLTADEWTRAKELYLGKPADARALALAHLRQIHGLYKEGVLSESEFNSKKWEILAQESLLHN